MKRVKRVSNDSSNDGFLQNFTMNTTKSGCSKYKINMTNTKNTTGSTNSLTLVAIMEGRGSDRGQIGIASMDLRHYELTICEFFDTNSYTLLKIRLCLLDPIEIIVPDYPNEKSHPTKLLKDMIESNFPNIDVNPVQRRFFNDSQGIELIEQLSAPGCSNFDSSMMLERIRNLFCPLHDLQQALTLCVHVSELEINDNEEKVKVLRSRIMQIIQLKKLLCMTCSLSIAFESAKCSLFRENMKCLEEKTLREAADLINDQIDDAVLLKKQKGSISPKDMVINAIKGGRHVGLDLVRKAYNELGLEVTKLISDEMAEIPGAQLSHSLTRGYYLTISTNEPYSASLPDQCMHIVRNRASVTFTTRKLIKQNVEQGDSPDYRINSTVSVMYNVVEFISYVDFLASLATYSKSTPSIRPTFSTQMIIKHGRHPILDYTSNEIVPNDTMMISDARFLIITGPNMAGKSTYMKQVCLLQVLAQIGCFVPADFAMFVPMCQIFSRVGHNDDLSRNLSAFALEMSEMSIILQNVTEKSLVIIDELARSTSTEEGMGICYAICEKLIKSKAFVFFATHFLDISLLELNFSTVQNFHFAIETEIDDDKNEILIPSHTLNKGMYKGPLYGLELAELTTLPEPILKSAREMATRLKNAVEEQHSKTNDPAFESRRLAHLAYRIIHLFNMDDVKKQSLSDYLKSLRKNYVEREF